MKKSIFLILFTTLMFLFQNCKSINEYENVEQCKVLVKTKKIDGKWVSQTVGIPPKIASIVKRRTQACEGALLCAQKDLADFLIKEKNVDSDKTATYIKGGIMYSKKYDEFNNCFLIFGIDEIKTEN